jgi:hypothetical protein
MAIDMPRSVYSSLLMLTALPAAIVGLGTGLAIGASTASVAAITLASFGLGLLSSLVAIALGRQEPARRSLPWFVRRAGLVFLPSALLLAVVLGGLSGVLFLTVAGTLALYQIVGFGQLDAWLYRRYGGCVGESS